MEGSEGAGTSSSKCTETNKPQKSPYWNDNKHSCWLGLAKLHYAFIDGQCTRVLIDPS